MRLLFFVLFCIQFTVHIKSQSLEFYRESLNFTLDTSNFTVSGMYFIRNTSNSEVSTPIFYPYVYPTKLIDTIGVYNCNTMEYLQVLEGKKGHRFNLKIPKTDTVVLHIKYSHKHNNSIATYILTTTKYWHKPFQVADYTLRVNQKIKVQELFEKPDTTWNDSLYQYYYWKRQHYMPGKDFTVEFEK